MPRSARSVSGQIPAALPFSPADLCGQRCVSPRRLSLPIYRSRPGPCTLLSDHDLCLSSAQGDRFLPGVPDAGAGDAYGRATGSHGLELERKQRPAARNPAGPGESLQIDRSLPAVILNVPGEDDVLTVT